MNPYEVLGVAPKADLATIKLAHRALARQYHPDLHPGFEAECAAVNAAWDVLSDSAQRKTLDTILAPKQSVCTRCEGVGKVWKQKGFKAKVAVECPLCKGKGV